LSAAKSDPADAIDLMRKEADLENEHAVDQKTLADTAQPLYASLDAQQRQRFADELKRVSRERVSREWGVNSISFDYTDAQQMRRSGSHSHGCDRQDN
jgi:hypothetical protein